MRTQAPFDHESARGPKGEAMTPFYFGPDDRLFGLYEKPSGSNAREDGVIVAYPMGHEYGRSHRGFRHLARLLTLAGFPVLRFDFFGSGDSRGEEDDGDLDRWVEDMVAAVEYMKSRSRRVGLVGSRLSGALAMKVGAETGPLESLALWHPVVDGKRYLREINAQHETHESKHGWQVQESRRLAGLESGVEVLGFHFSDRALRQIEQLDLAAIRRPPARRILLVDNGDSGELQQLRSHLERLGTKVDEAPIRESMMWFAEPYEMVFPIQSIQRIAQWFSEVHRA